MDLLVVASSWSPVVHLRSLPRIILTSEFGKILVLSVIEAVGPEYSCSLRKIDRMKTVDDRDFNNVAGFRCSYGTTAIG
jgi:hypothetical protein